MTKHKSFMENALRLAQRGEGMVSPNPMVGALLVHDGRTIGEGWHDVYGGPHAEVNCINSVAEENRAFISKSTLYVTLEPCFHVGKTPPCVDLVLKHKIKHVVIAEQDSNPLTAGKSIEKLRAGKVKVEVGVLEEKAHRLNRAFHYFIKTGKPYIILKWAQTDQGIMGLRGERLMITQPILERLVHQWRSGTDAILVGKNTAQTDNPQLNIREVGLYKPYLRIAWCSAMQLHAGAHLTNDTQLTWFLKPGKDDPNWRQTKHIPDVQNIEDLLAKLAEHKKALLFVEGGADTLNRFIDGGHWNEIRRITSQHDKKYPANKVIKAPLLPPSANLNTQFNIGPDHIEFYENGQI
jgi:diaminohydroxyphosphoribosylaminopyrimidine deaminase / 5-amino-6-(5-phosphoribosylamino)uracil reductase